MPRHRGVRGLGMWGERRSTSRTVDGKASGEMTTPEAAGSLGNFQKKKVSALTHII